MKQVALTPAQASGLRAAVSAIERERERYAAAAEALGQSLERFMRYLCEEHAVELKDVSVEPAPDFSALIVSEAPQAAELPQR